MNRIKMINTNCVLILQPEIVEDSFFLRSLLLHDELKTDEKSKLDLHSRIAPSIWLKKKKLSQLMMLIFSLLYKECIGEIFAFNEEKKLRFVVVFSVPKNLFSWSFAS